MPIKIWTKSQGLDRAIRQDLGTQLECIHCHAGYYIYFFPKQGGWVLACTYCFTKIDIVDYENLIMIRKALKKGKVDGP